MPHFTRISNPWSSVSFSSSILLILGTSENGALLDVYARKATKPQASVTFDGFPCAVGFTASNTVAVLTDAGCHTLRTDGKHYKSISFDGQAMLAYDISEKAVTFALQTDAVQRGARLVACDKKGNIQYEGDGYTDVHDLSLYDRTAWMLTGTGVVAVDLRRGTVAGTVEIKPGAVAVEGVGRDRAKLFYPAYLADVGVGD